MNNYQIASSDTALVTRVLAGEHSAFEPLLMRHYPSLVWLCQRIVGQAAALDIAQEAALAAFLDLPRLREGERFGAWLHGIAANIARMYLRQRRPFTLLHPDQREPLKQIPSIPSPEDVLIARELHDTILVALQELSHLNREAVIGFFLDGYGYAELAEILGVPVSTVKGRLFKGRQQLRARLALVAGEALAQPRTQKETKLETNEMVKVAVDGVRVNMVMQNRFVMLREENGSRVLPIFIGDFEAQAIALALEGHIPVRPMTHDLALKLVEAAGWQVRKITIDRLAEHTFYAQITLGRGKTIVEVDARPSDALALAVRNGAPIYALNAILESAVPQSKQDSSDAPQSTVQISETQRSDFEMLNRTWGMILEFWMQSRGKNFGKNLLTITEDELPETFTAQPIVIDNQHLTAIELVDGSEPMWLAVSHNVKVQLDEWLTQMRDGVRQWHAVIRSPLEPIPAPSPDIGSTEKV